MTKIKDKTEKNSAWNFDQKLVRQMADLMEEKNLFEMEFSQGDSSIRLSRGAPQSMAAATVPMPVSSSSQGTSPALSETDKQEGGVKSPMVGVVYMKPDPDSPPFVSVGEQVKEGQTLCLIEAMKVFNPILAQKGGVLKKVLVQTGELVEFDQVLFIIE